MEPQQFQPMTIGQILDRTFRLYSKHLITFIAIVAVVLVPLTVLQMPLTKLQIEAGADSTAWLAGALAGLLLSVLAIVGHVLSTGALLKAISNAYMGEEVSVSSSYRFVLPKLLSLIGASIVVGLVVGLGFLLIVPGIIFALMFALTTPALVCEDRRAFNAMSRSSELSKGNKGKIFLVWLLTWLISMGIALALNAVGGLVFGVAGIFHPNALAGASWSQVTGQALINLLSSILAVPISAGAIVLLYYDIRIRKEGFDLEMLAQSMGGQSPPVSPPPIGAAAGGPQSFGENLSDTSGPPSLK